MPNLGMFGADVPDLAAVGSNATGSKRDSGGRQELTSFSVKKGDNGGVLVCETYAKKPPAGRREGAAFPGGGDYKENPFSPDDGAAASTHITGLLSQMGVTGATPEPVAPPTPTPAIGGLRTPTAAAVGMRGPSGAAMVARPTPPPRDEGY